MHHAIREAFRVEFPMNGLFYAVSKRETHVHTAHLPFPILETILVRARISLLLALHGLEV
jgi:hypothetical protein